jgi:hypothetical protein
VAAELDKQNQLTIGAVTRDRLTGHGPFPVEQHRLGVRTNRLRSSLRNVPATSAGTRVDSAIGTNAKYAGVHEFGFDGEVTVRPHARKRYELVTFAGGVGKRKTRKRVRRADVFVGAFRRHMKVAARAPITTGVEERLGVYGAAIGQAIVDAWKDR